MTTALHPAVQKADDLLVRAAQHVHTKWARRTDTTKPYGIPEALAEAAGEDHVALIIAERQCVTYGLDIWWNDLLCFDGDDAAEELLKLTGIQPDVLYGHMWEANLGLLYLADSLQPDVVNGLSNFLKREQVAALADCYLLAKECNRDELLMHLCEDIHYAMQYAPTTPAGISRRLKAATALECVAAHHVLMDKLSLDMKATLVAPVAAMLPFGLPS